MSLWWVPNLGVRPNQTSNYHLKQIGNSSQSISLTQPRQWPTNWYTHTHRHGADDGQLAIGCSEDIINGRSTHNRQYILDTSEGKLESPGKKQRKDKFKSILQF